MKFFPDGYFLEKCAEETGPRIKQVLAEYHPDLVISSSRWELIAHRGTGGDTVVPASARWAEDVLVRFDGMHFTEGGARWFVSALRSRLPVVGRPR